MLNNITIITTMRCDLKCQHCLRGYPKARPDFPMDLLDKLLTEALPFGASHVGLTGGEPHLHPEFKKMVDKIVAYGYKWHFVSNGQRTDPYLPLMEKYRDQLTHVTLSVDGSNARTHDEIRNRKGAFDRVEASAKQYVELGYRVRLSATLSKKNRTEMEALVQLARDWGAYGINIAGMIPVDWGQDLVLNDAESLAIYQRVMDFREETNFDIRPLSSLYTRGGVNFCNNLNLCDLTFNASGELIFCCDTNDHALIGSLKELPLRELIKRWLKESQDFQIQRAERIASGNLGEKFDTCTCCNTFFS